MAVRWRQVGGQEESGRGYVLAMVSWRVHPGAQFTCFTSTKVQILTQRYTYCQVDRRSNKFRVRITHDVLWKNEIVVHKGHEVMSLLALVVQRVQIVTPEALREGWYAVKPYGGWRNEAAAPATSSYDANLKQRDMPAVWPKHGRCVCVCVCLCLSVCVCVCLCLSVFGTSRCRTSRFTCFTSTKVLALLVQNYKYAHLRITEGTSRCETSR